MKRGLFSVAYLNTRTHPRAENFLPRSRLVRLLASELLPPHYRVPPIQLLTKRPHRARPEIGARLKVRTAQIVATPIKSARNATKKVLNLSGKAEFRPRYRGEGVSKPCQETIDSNREPVGQINEPSIAREVLEDVCAECRIAKRRVVSGREFVWGKVR